MKKKLSIIIPVYNAESYIEQCILNIVNKDVPTSEYELIIVNDGSTDNTRAILETLRSRYSFIKLIDKENGGSSSARNEGLKHITGDYVFFHDDDDSITQNSLQFLTKWINEFDVDIFLFGFCYVYKNGQQTPIIKDLHADNKTINTVDYLLSYNLRSACWMCLFSKKIFTEHSIRFREGFMTEDDDFIVKAFSVSKQLVCNKKIIYHYCQRMESISNNVDYQHKEKLINDKTKLLLDLTNYIQPIEGKLKKGLEKKINFLAVDVIRLLIRDNYSSTIIDEILDELKKVNLYPIPYRDYSTKYRLFRIIFYYPFCVKAARIFRKYI